MPSSIIERRQLANEGFILLNWFVFLDVGTTEGHARANK